MPAGDWGLVSTPNWPNVPDFRSLRLSTLRKPPEFRDFLQETGDPWIGRSGGWAERIRTRVRRPHFAPLIFSGGIPPEPANFTLRDFLDCNGFPEIWRRRFPYTRERMRPEFAVLTACQPGSVSALQSPPTRLWVSHQTRLALGYAVGQKHGTLTSCRRKGLFAIKRAEVTPILSNGSLSQGRSLAASYT
jgi:hypothetical protein